MAFTYAQLATRADELILENATGTPQSSEILSATITESSARAALRHYHKDFPLWVHEKVTGNDSAFYPLTGGSAVLTEYDEFTSEIKEVRWPWDDTATDADLFKEENLVQPSEYEIDYWASQVGASLGVTAKHLIFLGAEPTSSQEILIKYTKLHTLNGLDSETVTTVPDGHFQALAFLTAYYMARTVMAHYGFSQKGTIQADVIAYESKMDIWRRALSTFLDGYNMVTGLDAPSFDMIALAPEPI